jgi:hypothetical protein
MSNSVAKVVVFASIHEKLLERNHKCVVRSHNYRQLSSAAKSDAKPSVTPSDMWKARQLREHRRANELCFKCGDKFAPGHKCANQSSDASLAQLYVEGSSVDGGGFLSEDILTALELSTMSNEENHFISLNAITSTQSNKVIHLRALVGNQALSILIDSGISRSFLNSSMLTRTPYTTVNDPDMRVKVANGHTVVSTQVVRDLEWWIQGCTFLSVPECWN